MRERAGRIVVIAGLAGMCATMFLPHVELWQTRVVPIDIMMEQKGFPEWAGLGWPFVFALAGVPMLLVRDALRETKGERVMTWAVCAVCLGTLAWGGVVVSMLMGERRVVPGVIAGVLFAYGVVRVGYAVVRAGARWRGAACMQGFGMVSGAYLGAVAMVRLRVTYYGIWLSLIACGVVVAGAMIERGAQREAAERTGET